MANVAPPDVDAVNDKALVPRLIICRGINCETIQEILHEDGYQAKIQELEDCVSIASSSNGTSYRILLQNYDEKLQGYTRLTTRTSYPNHLDRVAALQSLNDFNLQFPFVKGQIATSGDVRIQVDWLVDKGVALAQIAQWLALWRAIMCVFEDYWCEIEDIV